MKVIHFESGLGNQMLNYAEYLAMKEANPDDKCYMESIIYDIPEVNKTICQWNGYELDRIFGLELPNIRDLFSEEEWKGIEDNVRKSKFWKDGWEYPSAIVGAFRQEGLELENHCVARYLREKTLLEKLRYKLVTSNPGMARIKLAYNHLTMEKSLNRRCNPDLLFMSSNKDCYVGQTGLFMFNGNNIERIENKLRESFKFPAFEDSRDMKIACDIVNSQSVSIHARRGDALKTSGYYYQTGYFKRATHYIKRKTLKPVFYFFSDPGSIEWCKENLELFGLSENDEILFVDWHNGSESFRDMQLMALSKHNIITYSSFGWWASFLNENPEKITCSPLFHMNTTHHF